MEDPRQHSKDRKDHMQQKTQKPSSAGKRRIRNICVYCGSNPGPSPAYAAAARASASAWPRSASASSTAPAAWA